ncbi:coproporphyrinogen III oxidase family protein [Martelella alba]|uniref:Coproporphyrinogen III oxidase family protein n=1 Tax=Martelella alba TaxID=2590451 RepID=A0A506U1G7_9HYPH|nr:coproporphyrinogen-III oxidase family protein [Martelella alba]TPW27348.1 coproporphyrinogen III oxidase family protein [Martelella alba]
MSGISFKHREPIGSSTFPMPGDAVDIQEIDRRLASPAGRFNDATIYLHIPFCDQICSFCGFNKAVSNETTKERYVNALIREIALQAQSAYVQSLRFGAVYLGGGTPNALSAGQLGRILEALHNHLHFDDGIEITCEGIIQNFTRERIDVLKAHGVNRVSAGIQTFDRAIREAHLHMRDGREELLEGIATLRNNFSNFNLDFIYNLPNQTDAIWEEDVHQALTSGATHLTLYPLVLLEKTIFYSDYVKNGKYASPEETREIAMYRAALNQIADSPFRNRYSVRDFALPGRDCRYIRMNAESNHILALGAGAHGYLAGFTYRIIRSTQHYMEHVEQNGTIPFDAMRLASTDEQMRRYAVMGLRMRNLDLAPFEARFGRAFFDVFAREIEDLSEGGYLIAGDGRLNFTEKGDVWANNVRTHFEGKASTSVGYTDTTSIGQDGKTHYSAISRIKASGDVEANA